MTLRLLVLRHAHAAEPVSGMRDADRPLSGRGVEEARAVGLRVRSSSPDAVLCSPAVRTRETLALLRLDDEVLVDRDPRLYLAAEQTLLDALREVDALDADVRALLLVGHNPGLYGLVLELTGGERVPGFPPAALAVVDLDVDAWWAVGPDTGRLTSLNLPQMPQKP